MRIAIVNCIYFSADRHLELAKGFWESVSSEHEIIKIATVTHCAEQYAPWVLSTYDHIVNIHENRLAKACNKAFNLALYHLDVDYVFYCNTDTILAPGCIDNLIEFATTHPEYVSYSPVQYQGDPTAMLTKAPYYEIEVGYDATAFMFNKNLPEKVGLFPEHYKGAYFEDNFMASNIGHSEEKAVKYSESRLFHYGSQTIMNDPEVRVANDANFDHNRNKYLLAWGGPPGEEKWINKK